jgi:uncharacterized membrane protein YfcA
MLLVGATLGLLGSGGSVLTVPILVYAFGMGMPQATGYSLLIVGVTSLAGVWTNWRRELVSLRVTAWFAIPSLISVYLTRAFLVPHLPASVERMLMAAFAALMIAAALAMIRRRSRQSNATGADCSCPALMAEGFVIGVVAGLLGAGGGFLIVPALVLLGRLPMPLAIGTSLTIIAVQSLIGFAGAYQGGMAVDWLLLALLTGAALVGMVAGLRLSPHIAAHQLRTAFGWFLLLAGVAIGARELLYSGY